MADGNKLTQGKQVDGTGTTQPKFNRARMMLIGNNEIVMTFLKRAIPETYSTSNEIIDPEGDPLYFRLMFVKQLKMAGPKNCAGSLAVIAFHTLGINPIDGGDDLINTRAELIKRIVASIEQIPTDPSLTFDQLIELVCASFIQELQTEDIDTQKFGIEYKARIEGIMSLLAQPLSDNELVALIKYHRASKPTNTYTVDQIMEAFQQQANQTVFLNRQRSVPLRSLHYDKVSPEETLKNPGILNFDNSVSPNGKPQILKILEIDS